MKNTNRRGREVVALGSLLACVLMACAPNAFALDPSLDVGQYGHKAWKISDGFFDGTIRSIAQTPDGYLWLATEFGLRRFDGVRSVLWQSPALPSNDVWSVIAARDGTLWVGTSKGLASWKDGKLTQYPELAGYFVPRLLEDRDGWIWAGFLGAPTGKLCSIQKGNVRCYGEDGSLGYGVLGLYEDSMRNLWIGAPDGLWQWKPGPPKFYPMPGELDAIQGFAQSDDGALLITTRSGVRRFVDGKTEPYARSDSVRPNRLLRDRDGGLWIGTSRGVAHVHQGRTDIWTQSDGLSSDDVGSLFEDREGNIWVGTDGGLDRFRDLVVATFAQRQGLPATADSVLAVSDGSVLLSTPGGLNRWVNGHFKIVRTAKGKPDGKLNGFMPNSIFQDSHGRVWVSTLGGVGYLEKGEFTSISGVPAGNVHDLAEDAEGNLWIANQAIGLIQLSPRGAVQQIPWTRLEHKDHGTALAADPSGRGLWVGFFQGGIKLFIDAQVRASYAADDGLGQGLVSSLRVDGDGSLWATTQGGLSRLKNGRVANLSSRNGLPCDAVHWMIEDDDHSFWLYMPCGVVQIARTELEAWAAAADQGKDAKFIVRQTLFDSSDGVRPRPLASGYKSQVAKSADGKLWFTGTGSAAGLGVIDPRHLPFNSVPPPVHIEQVIADRKIYDTASAAKGLPARIRDLEIDYTALSFVAPEKVRFRYKLEGWDRDWQDVGTRRQAFYNNLPPRNYRFRVSAANNSGVWNEAGASLDFSIAPAYYQTDWFRALVVAAFVAMLAAIYQLRLRYMTRQFNIRLEERVRERTRIARDLHDTLLQSFQGVLLRFHTVTYLLPHRPDEARNTLETVIEQAREAIIEGRDAVQGLRSLPVINDVGRAITTLGEELAAEQAVENRPTFSVHVEGTPRELAPFPRDETYRIAIEAVRNAFRHAHATHIEVEIHYGQRQLRLRIRDNGKGMDPNFLGGRGREGHYGLTGMHERAKAVQGKLAVWSKLDSGTEAELTIPASIAYAKSPAGSRLMSSEKGT